MQVDFSTNKIFLFVKFTTHYKQIKLDKIELILVNVVQTLKRLTKPDKITQWHTSKLDLKSGIHSAACFSNEKSSKERYIQSLGGFAFAW